MERALIIDDDLKNIFALEATLRAKGWDVLTASSALEGISLLDNVNDINIVLMDMMMPELDGYEAISIIRQKESIRNVPIIAVTAQAMPGDRERCLSAGADGYIPKPVDVEKLFELINQFVKSDKAL